MCVQYQRRVQISRVVRRRQPKRAKGSMGVWQWYVTVEPDRRKYSSRMDSWWVCLTISYQSLSICCLYQRMRVFLASTSLQLMARILVQTSWFHLSSPMISSFMPCNSSCFLCSGRYFRVSTLNCSFKSFESHFTILSSFDFASAGNKCFEVASLHSAIFDLNPSILPANLASSSSNPSSTPSLSQISLFMISIYESSSSTLQGLSFSPFNTSFKQHKDSLSRICSSEQECKSLVRQLTPFCFSSRISCLSLEPRLCLRSSNCDSNLFLFLKKLSRRPLNYVSSVTSWILWVRMALNCVGSYPLTLLSCILQYCYSFPLE